eukprot:7639737-Pyramimonas_sp.AAC.1
MGDWGGVKCHGHPPRQRGPMPEDSRPSLAPTTLRQRQCKPFHSPIPEKISPGLNETLTQLRRSSPRGPHALVEAQLRGLAGRALARQK